MKSHELEECTKCICSIPEQKLKGMSSEVEKCSPEEVDLNSWNHIETEQAICKVEEPKKDNLIRCPYCEESYYREEYSTCTAMYFSPIYKNGVNINPYRNRTAIHCHCMNCGKDFSYKI